MWTNNVYQAGYVPSVTVVNTGYVAPQVVVAAPAVVAAPVVAAPVIATPVVAQPMYYGTAITTPYGVRYI
ncbi:hypothetical protein CAEBREN_05121 [Caenorhabditis brenneri]|uniref:Uncharacterized protein n=1 Tax=Caenorhabditis brenneri TaxID=135651 RepID=G0P8J3_CAEBE|nr:hypothetical protein CAEBREN_05121 [Caenorhabditis brenneri]